METANFKIKTRFLGKWILAVSIAWPVGMIMAIILSYAVVNLFYHKETNLIVGLCIGAAVGFAQWLVLKKYFKIISWWIFASAFGLGIPFALMVILDETGTVFPAPFNNEYLSLFIVGCIGGFLNGIFQLQIFKSFSQNSEWWVAISTISWGISMLFTFTNAGIILGGIMLGTLTGFSVLRLIKFTGEGTV